MTDFTHGINDPGAGPFLAIWQAASILLLLDRVRQRRQPTAGARHRTRPGVCAATRARRGPGRLAPQLFIEGALLSGGRLHSSRCRWPRRVGPARGSVPASVIRFVPGWRVHALSLEVLAAYAVLAIARDAALLACARHCTPDAPERRNAATGARNARVDAQRRSGSHGVGDRAGGAHTGVALCSGSFAPRCGPRDKRRTRIRQAQRAGGAAGIAGASLRDSLNRGGNFSIASPSGMTRIPAVTTWHHQPLPYGRIQCKAASSGRKASPCSSPTSGRSIIVNLPGVFRGAAHSAARRPHIQLKRRSTERRRWPS